MTIPESTAIIEGLKREFTFLRDSRPAGRVLTSSRVPGAYDAAAQLSCGFMIGEDPAVPATTITPDHARVNSVRGVSHSTFRRSAGSGIRRSTSLSNGP